MAETQRTEDDFNNASTGLFKDNTAGDISPQDLRDLVESLHLNFGTIYMSTAVETVISSGDTWTKSLGTTTSVSLRGFDMPANNRLRYTGTPSVHLHGIITLTSSTAAANKTLGYGAYFYDDSAASGSVITSTEIRRRHTSTDIGAAAVAFDQVVDTNDYIELHIKNITDSTNATVDYMYMSITAQFV